MTDGRGGDRDDPRRAARTAVARVSGTFAVSRPFGGLEP